MHPGAHHGGAVPVGGVDEAIGTVRSPAVGDGLVVQGDGRLNEALRRVGPERLVHLDEQPRPLHPVADGGAVGAEGIGGLVAVVVEQRFPPRGQVFGNPPVVVSCQPDHPLGNPAGAPVPGAVPRRVPGGEERLDGVHVGVDPAVVVQGDPRAVPLLHNRAGGLVPEVLLHDRQGHLQQPLGARYPGHQGACCREENEGVRVGGFDALGTAIGLDGCKPAAEVLVVERPLRQRPHTVLGQRCQLGAVWATLGGRLVGK